ncbi:SDR family oxidoreductase [Actinophytocola sp.]|uniref:SDR family oxidoreductase n=1 Tax=Actinophytocola sp. TaxID=1872138 RepID=UPI00389A8C00
MSRVVVVTGASAGVGRAVAKAFAARGDRVALVARGDAGLKAAVAEITEAGGAALALTADVTDYTALEQAADTVEQELGPIDVWVNNAFAAVFAPFLKVRPEEYRRVTDVTYHGYVHGTRIALDRMTRRDSGVVVQVGSALAYRGIPLQSAYCGAKHAIEGFTESVRCELLHDGSAVRITVVQLPAVNTPQFDWALSRMPRKPQPVPPIYQPEVAARAVVHAADHPRRRERWVGGSTMGTILANKIFPGLLDHYLARTGYKSQETADAETNRPNNLWAPVDAQPGSVHTAHGRFDDQAKDTAPTTSTLARGAAAGVAALGGVAWLLTRRMRGA